MAKYSKPQEVFDAMVKEFDAEKAGNIDARAQLNLSGDDGGEWYMIIGDGKMEIEKGTLEDPEMTMSMEDKTWVDLTNGDANAMMLFMQGKIKVTGDMQLALQLQKLF